VREHRHRVAILPARLDAARQDLPFAARLLLPVRHARVVRPERDRAEVVVGIRHLEEIRMVRVGNLVVVAEAVRAPRRHERRAGRLAIRPERLLDDARRAVDLRERRRRHAVDVHDERLLQLRARRLRLRRDHDEILRGHVGLPSDDAVLAHGDAVDALLRRRLRADRARLGRLDGRHLDDGEHVRRVEREPDGDELVGHRLRRAGADAQREFFARAHDVRRELDADAAARRVAGRHEAPALREAAGEARALVAERVASLREIDVALLVPRLVPVDARRDVALVRREVGDFLRAVDVDGASPFARRALHFERIPAGRGELEVVVEPSLALVELVRRRLLPVIPPQDLRPISRVPFAFNGRDALRRSRGDRPTVVADRRNRRANRKNATQEFHHIP
jgi:hypothetical protein